MTHLEPTGNQVQTFTFAGVELRAVLVDGNPWFVGPDIAVALEYRDGYTALRSVRDKNKATHIVCTPSGQQECTCVNEPGLYQLIMSSRSAKAEAFQDWVTDDVLPQIRKTGGYGAPAVPQTFAEALQLAADSQREIERQAEQLAIAAPKVEAYEAHVDSDGGITIRALAKQLADDNYRVTCKDMYRLLNTVGFIYRQGETWVPYETARRDGLATSRMDVCADGRTREVALVTPAGVLEVRRRLSHLRAAGNQLATG